MSGEACPGCGGPKGCDSKQACNECWARLCVSAKRRWYGKLWVERNSLIGIEWFRSQMVVMPA